MKSPGYTGDGSCMRAGSQGTGAVAEGWRYWDRGMHPDTEYLSKADFKAPMSVGRFLPDAPVDEEYAERACPGLNAKVRQA